MGAGLNSRLWVLRSYRIVRDVVRVMYDVEPDVEGVGWRNHGCLFQVVVGVGSVQEQGKRFGMQAGRR